MYTSTGIDAKTADLCTRAGRTGRVDDGRDGCSLRIKAVD